MAKGIITPEAILSYPVLDEPRLPPKPKPGDKPKYSVTLVFTPEVQATDSFKAVEEALMKVAVDKWGPEVVRKIKAGGTFKWGIRSDWEQKGYPEGARFINARSESQPGMVFLWPDPETRKAQRVPDDQITKVFYAGAVVRAEISPFAYDYEGMSQGASFGVNNLQKLRDGKRLDGRKAPDEVFDADQTLEPADLSDLEPAY